jgi:hypothetical protein
MGLSYAVGAFLVDKQLQLLKEAVSGGGLTLR